MYKDYMCIHRNKYTHIGAHKFVDNLIIEMKLILYRLERKMFKI